MADLDDLALPSLQKLQSAEQMELLDVVDSLRALGLGEIVDLPQLIVCGDQSSGKSSVLEAISGIPFPRQDNLCTRFATEVILRRATKDEISVTIVPGEDRTPVEREALSHFRRDLKSKEDFKDLFEIARDAMGLTSTGKSFSNDILRVTFCGPSQPQLTLVDLPGLIHSETKSQTAADVKLVHNLVSGYLQNPRSIILAVVSAKNDIGNQIILRRAREVDPKGFRTLGIITKPDLLVKGSKTEEAFIALARNEDVKFTLGWHVVKNLDASLQNPDDSRDDQETIFFETSNFNSLPAHLLGINFLRARLSKVLFGQIQTELPRLVDDIEWQISIAKSAKDKLGPSRKTIEEQQSFLISLSQTFQTICRDAARGDYDHEFFQDDPHPDRRLCANVMNLHFAFAKNMRENGSTWLIGDGHINDIRYRTREEAIEEACKLLKNSRGRELPGLPNPLLVGEIFRQYSRPWGPLARLHIRQVWETTNRFFEHLLQYLTDIDVHDNIYRFWLYPIMEERLNTAYGKLDELLEVHKDHPMTTNSHFIKNRKELAQESSKEKLEAMLMIAESQPGKGVSVDEITDLLSTMKSNAELDMDMIAAEEAFDNMNIYYEVALNLFTDNVPTLAIQAPIIKEVPKIFCPTAVFSMNPDIIKRIAGETDEKILERDNILRRLSILENGALVCKQYAKRPQPSVTLPSGQLHGDDENDGSNSHSTHKSFSGSLPKNGTYSNPFGYLSTPARPDVPSPNQGQKSVNHGKYKSSLSENGSTGYTETEDSNPGTNAAFKDSKIMKPNTGSSIFGGEPIKGGFGLGASPFGALGSKETPSALFSSKPTSNTPSLFSGLRDKETLSDISGSKPTSNTPGLFSNLGSKETSSSLFGSKSTSITPGLFSNLGSKETSSNLSGSKSTSNTSGLFSSLGIKENSSGLTGSKPTSNTSGLFSGLGSKETSSALSGSKPTSNTPGLFGALGANNGAPKPTGTPQSNRHFGSDFIPTSSTTSGFGGLQGSGDNASTLGNDSSIGFGTAFSKSPARNNGDKSPK